jgi:hypothetical protein
MHRWRMPEGLRWYNSFSSPSKTNDLARRASRRASALSRGISPWRRYSTYGVCQFGTGDPILLHLNTQGLTLGGRGYLRLGRGLLRFGHIVEFDGWLIYVPREDVRGNRRSPRGYFRQLIRSLVVPSSNMVELYPVELVFQAPNCDTMKIIK